MGVQRNNEQKLTPDLIYNRIIVVTILGGTVRQLQDP